MGIDRLRLLPALLLILAMAALPVPVAAAQEVKIASLPGSESWSEYIEKSPVTAEEFTEDPLDAMRSFLPHDMAQTMRKSIEGYAGLLLFLLAAALLSFLIEGTENRTLLELVSACGCVLMTWTSLTELAEQICERLESWRLFLLGFIPIYAGVLTAGGEAASAAAANGFFLSGLCMLAQLLAVLLPPVLQCYLALSAACCISTEPALASACRALGRLMRKGLSLAGKAFSVLLGLQRIFTGQLDRTTTQLGQLLTGAVPVIGQSLSDASQVVLAGMQTVKSGLGFAAIAILAAEFLPLYIILMLHVALLSGCGLLCEAAGVHCCAALFGCLEEAVQGMAAATALFFGLTAAGTLLFAALGGG